MVPSTEPAPTPVRPRVPLQRQGQSANPKRAVFLGTWGTTPGGLSASLSRALDRGSGRSVSFHQVILVTDGTTRQTTVSRATEAEVIDWGMYPKPGARSKHFNYEDQQDKGNTYVYVGETYWTNDQIESLVAKLGYQYARYDDSMKEYIGHKYDWDNNNCRHMAGDAIQAITKFPAMDRDDNEFVQSVAEVLLSDRKILIFHYRRQLDYAAVDGAAAADINSVIAAAKHGLAGLQQSGELQILEPDNWGWDQLRSGSIAF